MRRARAYSSYCLQVVLIHLHSFRRNSFFAAENCKQIIKNPYFGFKVIQGDRCWHP